MLCLTPSRPQAKAEDFLPARAEGSPEGFPLVTVEDLNLAKAENSSPCLENWSSSLKTVEDSHLAKV